MATTATAARVRHIAAAKRAKAPISARTSLDDAGSSDDQVNEVKYSLGFILNLSPSDAVKIERVEAPTPLETRPEPRMAVIQNHLRDSKDDTKRSKPRARSNVETTVATPPTKPTRARSTSSGAKTKSSANGKAKAALTYEQKRLARKCTVEDCMNYTINKGLCFRHGGGKKCTFADCNASAKIAGLCWKHGGSIQCVIDGCDRRGKSRGLCWAHGGGTKCHADACTKVAVSNGYCWAHGGGKRCHFNGCQRPAYERTLNYCPKHFKRFENGEEVLEL